jgi:hypothetical protein
MSKALNGLLMFAAFLFIATYIPLIVEDALPASNWLEFKDIHAGTVMEGCHEVFFYRDAKKPIMASIHRELLLIDSEGNTQYVRGVSGEASFEDGLQLIEFEVCPSEVEVGSQYYYQYIFSFTTERGGYPKTIVEQSNTFKVKSI